MIIKNQYNKMGFTPLETLNKKTLFGNLKAQKFLTGFTITEIIVAITVFSIGVLGLAAFFASSSQTTRNSSNLSIASNIAEGLIDEQLNQSYSSLNVGTGTKTRVSEDTASPFYNFQKQINISLVDSNLNPSATDVGLKKIDIYVYYNEGTTEKNVQTATLKTQR